MLRAEGSESIHIAPFSGLKHHLDQRSTITTDISIDDRCLSLKQLHFSKTFVIITKLYIIA